MTTNEQCLKTALEKLEVDSKLRRQQFGSHIEGSPERGPSPVPKPSPRIIRKTDQESFSNKGICFFFFVQELRIRERGGGIN